ncbi:uncharacterized protein LOC129598855 [Paramacrobiotus metropolitanus]|uniref:uncharacterized protein LOC129598855 n=1 Tax=Paramacrobiotus metropolitanus TaxID=2943436 RepID=UPI002445A2AC|nr:uncharacterized protein LOC129598855 [Paramacrobiotus metropolitanus]XP_055352908.1 uncharacterized protein LOC129598855 [Paramacrobiotus metropolitanus]XP_055352909.1 uncharacterized protein LOC129598855 [Paramacrobiotus metropolitanus]XP_055352910.1 uncharacterized protein LOC129598855 [Paramacrobiotus metropolitanus]XP_055352911.1 uncharacterized protein LOC129598855 [Paramacrobiotus metropolitanus]
MTTGDPRTQWLVDGAIGAGSKLIEDLALFIATQTGRLTVIAINKILDRIDPASKTVRGDFLDYYLLFDARDEILEIHRELQRTTTELQQSIHVGNHRLSVLIQHHDVDLKLHTISHYLTEFLSSHGALRDHYKQEFLEACRGYDPKGLLIGLHKMITTTDATGQFLNDLIECCEYEPFLQWCDKIALNAFRAHLCALHRLHLIMQDGTISDTVFQGQHKTMEAQRRDIAKALKSAQIQYARRAFVGNDHRPSDLVTLIDNFMIRCDCAPKTANQQLAETLGAELAQRYPWFAWAVVIAEDNPRWRNFISYSEDFQQNLFLKESVHQQFMPILGKKAAPAPVHRTVLSGENYGIFTCKRKFYAGGKLAHRRRLTVFWINHNDIIDVKLSEDDKRGLVNVNIRKVASDFNVQQIKERKLCRTEEHNVIEETLFKNGYQYIACFGLRKARDKNDTGVYFTNQIETSSWPLYIQNENGHLLLWLTNVTQKAMDRQRRFDELWLADVLVRGQLDIDEPTRRNHPVSWPSNNPARLLKLAAESNENGNRLLSRGYMESAVKEYEYAKYLLDHSNGNSKKRTKLLRLTNCNLAHVYLLIKDVYSSKNAADAVLQFEADNPRALMSRFLANLGLTNLDEAKRDIARLATIAQNEPEPGRAARPSGATSPVSEAIFNLGKALLVPSQSERIESGVLLKVIELATLARGDPRTPREEDPRKDKKFWSMLPEIVFHIMIKVDDAADAEPDRKDTEEVLDTLSTVGGLIRDVLERLVSEQDETYSRLLVGWLDAVFQAVNDLIRMKKEWIFVERETAQVALQIVKLLITSHEVFLKSV